jgi:hypothetical protein
MNQRAMNIPLWLKVLYTVFVLLLVPVYTVHHGLGNFLWFSNVALLTTMVALWWQSRLLISMMALATLIPETGWLLDFLVRLLTGNHLFGLTEYMWDPLHPLLVRALSLYHIPLPILLLWLVYRLGYDRRAFFLQSGLAATIFLATYFVTDPEKNVNYAFGFPDPGAGLPQPWHLLSLVLLIPLGVYLPTHIVLHWCFTKPSAPPASLQTTSR